jgi:hypothetical protein
MAFARASGQWLVNLSLDEYRDLFPATRPPFKRGLNRRFHRVVRGWIVGLKRLPIAKNWFVSIARRNPEDYSPDNPSFLATLKRRPLTFLEGFPDPSRIRFPTATADAVRATFQPEAKVAEVAQDTVRVARGGADVLVGVHIRLGDYRRYRRGIFHYQLQDYRRMMERMTALLSAMRVAFLVCSDEQQESGAFAPFQVTIGPGTLLGDLFALAGCDYLVGPPSTYSLWAAFYGRKPLYHMVEPEPPADLSAFMVPDGHFECADLKLDDREIEGRRRSRGILPISRV